MDYSRICEVYARLEGTSKGLEKTEILASFLGEIRKSPKFIYLLKGKLFADYESRELGVSVQLVIKAISRAGGILEEEVVENFRKLGDLGKVAEEVLGKKKKQQGLFESKLSVEKVVENLKKVVDARGSGAVDLKIGYIVDLLHSASKGEAKYIVRTVLGDLKIGVGVGILRDAIAVYCFEPKGLEDKKVCTKAVQEAYDKATDFAEVFEKACSDSLEKIKLTPGRPLKVMLFPKAENIEDAFRIVGRPAAFEYKYDGFRVMVNKGEDGEVKVFTRALENVTRQFPEIVEYVNEYVSGKNFILDGEAVGFDSETLKYTDFQAISQRIRRKHGIGEMRKKLPIELVVFDIVFLDGDSLIDVSNLERWKILERIVLEKEKKIVLAKRIVTEDLKEVEKFYDEAIEDNQEGLMGKKLDAPYKPGARIGHAVKLKPDDNDFDLVITGAEWGTGKRAGWLTSFDVSCRGGLGVGGVGELGAGEHVSELGNVVLVHGSAIGDKDKIKNGRRPINERNWYTWFKNKLVNLNIDVEIPLMPKNYCPKYEKWKNRFEEIEVNENSILIGHSNGAAFLVRWLGETKRKIKKLILIAPSRFPLEGSPNCFKRFKDFEIDMGIKSRVEEVIIFVSNDKDNILKSAKLFHNKLGGRYIELKNRKHFGYGNKEFPELLEEILPRNCAELRGKDGELFGVGKVSTGLKELKEEGTSFSEMTDILEKIVIGVDGRHVEVKPEVVVSVRFQDVQKSPTNSSGFALRFPRILRLRPDRGVGDIASLSDIEAEVEKN